MLDVIYDRRSIRKYQNKPIEDEKLNKILRAGMYAPSGMNKQPWTFVVCTERNTLDEVQKNSPVFFYAIKCTMLHNCVWGY